MNIRFQDLNFYALQDGSIRLEQLDYAGEASVIDAHPEQIKFIARQLCGLTPETVGQVRELERRIAVLTDRLQNFVCNKAFRSDLVDGIAEGFEYLAKLDGVLDLSLEFDGGRLEPEYRDSEQQEGHCASKPIHPPSVIDQAKKSQHSAIAEGGEQLGLGV